MSNPSKITMWKPPPRRDYTPKPMDPGQVVVWTHRTRGYWTVPSRYDPEANTCTPAQGWIPALDTERIGTIWSDGSSPSTWWVLPDDDMLNPVLVRRAGKRHVPEWREGDLFQSTEGDGWRDAVRRAENVRRHGMYAVVKETYTAPGRMYGPRETRHVIEWHADPQCPHAAGKQRYDGTGEGYGIGWTGPGYETWNAMDATDVLIGRVQLSSPPPFCPRCIMLEPEPARELVTA
jgi:hypothetical protein